MDFRELLGIIDGYIFRGCLSQKDYFLDSDSLLVVNSTLTSQSHEISNLGALASNFFNMIDRGSASFSHIKKEGNIPAQF